jgi:hypothetical protein
MLLWLLPLLLFVYLFGFAHGCCCRPPRRMVLCIARLPRKFKYDVQVHQFNESEWPWFSDYMLSQVADGTRNTCDIAAVEDCRRQIGKA